MHDFIMGIGQGILNWLRNIDTANILNALEITGIGWLGIFIVTGVIILVVTLLTWLARKFVKE